MEARRGQRREDCLRKGGERASWLRKKMEPDQEGQGKSRTDADVGFNVVV